MTDTISFPLLFSPMKIGQLELKNRLVMSPVGTRLAHVGKVTDAFKEFYAARARGGVGLIVLEPCFVEPTDEPKFLSLYDDNFIPGLKELVETIHSEGAKIGVQLFHAGWQPGAKQARFLPPIPPAEISLERIKELVGKFAQAASRTKVAGFDLIEIHAAHGYLLSQFLSPLGNQRDDEYGLDITGRTRFVVEVIQSVKERIGDELPLSCRINGYEHLPGGLDLEGAKEIAPVLVDAGLDLLSVSAGALGSYPLTIPPSDTKEGCYVHLAEGIKQVVSVPVVVVGRINTPDLAEETLNLGKADLIAMARGLVADPEFTVKTTNGEVQRIRKCIACNACLDTDYDGHILCTVNPVAGRETELETTPAEQSKKVMVIGGGLSGLQAAMVASIRGHKVVLYEETANIGGQWLLASSPLHKHEFEGMVSWLSYELKTLGVEIILGQSVTSATVKTVNPDAVIVATGALPAVPSVAGFEREQVITAWEVLRGNTTIGERVMVIGGGATGLETAEFLAEQGKKVSVVEMLKAFGTDMGGTVYFHLRTRLRKLAIELFKNTEVKEINESGVVVMRNGVEENWAAFDTYVLALGVSSRNDLAKELEGKVGELYVIGDANAPGNGANAMRQGYEIGMKI
ncbi:MAG: FAD-dependent oxidoreductase [Chloroflexi bacterium]|jgi:2,4-dienoyl-CoA reductase-like NADH-dependent reductase (Old Yellow Enzyme family)/NADPH-dependent 2,4-dienoyl-CoA reductase/sulfur reductase-like enzyme|nr:FAD-dependent oxidoreductase [Chloroflexota bacterium]